MGSGTPGQVPYYADTGGVLTATSSITILSNGNVGIGTTTPGTSLAVAGSGLFTNILTAFGLTTAPSFSATSTTATSTFAGNLSVEGNLNFNGAFLQNGSPFIGSQWTTAGSNIYYTAGNVGIGTATPSYKLDVSGIARFTGLVDAANFNATSTSATSTFAGGFSAGNNAALVVNRAATANALYINPSGNVGIGTTTPGAALEVVSSSSGTVQDQLFLTNSSSATSTASRLTFRTTDTLGNSTSTASISGILTQNWNAAKGQLALSTVNLGILSEAMRITDTGLVGIGTASPLWQTTIKQAVSGGGNTLYGGTLVLSRYINTITDQRSSAIYHYYDGVSTDMLAFGVDNSGIINPALIANAKMVIQADGKTGIGTTTPQATLQVQGTSGIGNTMQGTWASSAAYGYLSLNGTNGLGSNFYSTPTDPTLYINRPTGKDISFRENNTDQMTLLTGGNLGIGVINPATKLDIRYSSTVTSVAGLDNGILIRNTNATAGNLASIILDSENGAANNRIAITSKDSNTVFTRDVSGVFTESMRIDGSGNVGIGTTSPQSLLSISGSAAGNLDALTLTNTRGVAGDATRINFQTGSTYGTTAAISVTQGDTATRGDINFFTGNAGTLTHRMILKQNQVGFGTTTPTGDFQINGTGSNTRITLSNTGLSQMWFMANDSDTFGIGTTSAITLISAGTYRPFTIGSTGNVGIGGTGSSPQAPLHLVGASTRGFLFNNNIIGLLPTDGTFFSLATNNGDFSVTNQESGKAISLNTAAGVIRFSQDQGTTEAGRFDTTGNFGIGTTSPGQKLSVAGDILGNNLIGSYFTATSTTATSTFAGGVGIGTNTPAQLLEISGALATATINSTSLVRMSRTFNSGIKYGNAAEFALGSYSVSTNSHSRVDLKLSHGATSAPDMTAMTWLSNGNVGIGQTAPTVSLQFSDTTGDKIRLFGSTPTQNYGMGIQTFEQQFYIPTNNAHFSFNAGGDLQAVGTNELMRIMGTGNVGIASSTPWRTLSVNGTVALNGLTSSATGNALCITSAKEITDAGGASCTPSSIRFKENVETLTDGFALDELNKLRIVSFDYKPGFYSIEDSPGSYGLIAEEVADIDTKLVDYGYDGQPLTLKFEKLTGLAIQAIQELSKKVGALSAVVAGFSDSFTTKHLCVEKADGTKVCITGEELDAFLSQGAQGGGSPIVITDVPPPAEEEPNTEVPNEEEVAPEEITMPEETPETKDAAPTDTSLTTIP